MEIEEEEVAFLNSKGDTFTDQKDSKQTNGVMMTAVCTMHRMVIKHNLSVINTFIDPIVQDPGMRQILADIINLCLRPHFNHLENMIDNLVKQISAIEWKSDEVTGDIIWYMRNEGHLFLTVSSKDGQQMAFPMHYYLLYADAEIASGKHNKEMSDYIMYCRDITFVHLEGICKMAVECEIPKLSISICKHLNERESDLDMPMTSVDRSRSIGSRRMTTCMANILHNVGNKCFPDDVDTVIDDTHIKYVENYIGKIFPHLSTVCSTVQSTIESASNNDISESGIEQTLANAVAQNVAQLVLVKNDDGELCPKSNTTPPVNKKVKMLCCLHDDNEYDNLHYIPP